MRRWAAAAAVSLALAACGGDGGRGVADEVAGPLAERVAAVRAAAAEDRERALVELGVLREEVAGYTEGGDLSDAAAERILSAVEAVEAALADLPAAAPTTTTPTTPTTTTPPPTVTTTTTTAGDGGGPDDPADEQEQRPDEAEEPEDETSEQEPEEQQEEGKEGRQGEQNKREEDKREEDQGEQKGVDDEG